MRSEHELEGELGVGVGCEEVFAADADAAGGLPVVRVSQGWPEASTLAVAEAYWCRKGCLGPGERLWASGEFRMAAKRSR